MEKLEKDFWNKANELEKEIINKLEEDNKDKTYEELKEKFEKAKKELNSHISNPNDSRGERYMQWLKLETTYQFYYDKIGGDDDWNEYVVNTRKPFQSWQPVETAPTKERAIVKAKRYLEKGLQAEIVFSSKDGFSNYLVWRNGRNLE